MARVSSRRREQLQMAEPSQEQRDTPPPPGLPFQAGALARDGGAATRGVRVAAASLMHRQPRPLGSTGTRLWSHCRELSQLCRPELPPSPLEACEGPPPPPPSQLLQPRGHRCSCASLGRGLRTCSTVAAMEADMAVLGRRDSLSLEAEAEARGAGGVGGAAAGDAPVLTWTYRNVMIQACEIKRDSPPCSGVCSEALRRERSSPSGRGCARGWAE